MVKMAFKIGWFQNFGFKYTFLMLWSGVSITLFVHTFIRYQNDREYHYIRQILGVTLYIARGSATVISLNCAAILLPMCHTCLTLIRRLFKKLNIPFNLKCETKSFHIYFAYIILIFAASHVVSHLTNCQQFYKNFNDHILEANPFPQRPTYRQILLQTIPGVTGLLLVCVIILLVGTSVKYIRHRNFNVFWYTHRLFVGFYLLILVHGIRGPLRQQLNVSTYYPGCNIDNVNINLDNITRAIDLDNTSVDICNKSYIAQQWERATYGVYNKIDVNNTDTTHCVCTEGPIFGHIIPKTWQWLCVPLVLYICDFVLRLARRSRAIEVVDVQAISTDVYEIVFYRQHIRMKPGQYVLLKCPDVSTLEWHPFSVVQVATISNGWLFSVCIKRSGDWTEAVLRKLDKLKYECIPEKTSIQTRFPQFHMDGPFSSVMEHVINYKVALCIGGGVGVTPFISHLLHIRHTLNAKSRLKKLHFIVVSKDERLLAWCGNICKSVYTVINDITKDLLDIRLFLTNGKTSLQSCSFLSERTYFKRPDLTELFNKSIPTNYRGSVGVFCCGPNGLNETVRQHCVKHSNLSVKLCFHKETF